MKILAKKGIKVNTEEGDGHKTGEPLLVIGETAAIEFRGKPTKGYLVLFKDFDAPVATVEHKVHLDGREEEIVLSPFQRKHIVVELFNLYKI